ncbi:MAG TPA: hypothetical protein VEV15_01480, partial [Flavisolibacter sp.]|nr:hypothetical protein [Flavisolibacter sp.]
TNKSTNVTTDGASDTKYPSVKAVKTYVDAQVTTPDANATTKGKIKLAGDLAGTADLPAVADNAITTTKINNGAVTDAKLATGISASKISVGTIAIANGGTGASTQAGAANALLPAQTGQSGKVLQTDGTNVSWAPSGGGSLPTPANPADNGKVLTANAGAATWQTPTGGATNLGYTVASRTVTSSTGTGTVLPLATTTEAGLLANTDKAKLDKIATINPAADANKVLTVKSDGSTAEWVTPAAGGGGGAMQVYRPKNGGGTPVPNFLVKASANTVTCTFDKNAAKVIVNIPAGVQLEYLKIHSDYKETNSNTFLTFEITGLGNIGNDFIQDVIVPTAMFGVFDGGGIVISPAVSFTQTYASNKLTYGVAVSDAESALGYMVILRF